MINSNLKGRDYISLADFTADEFQELLQLAVKLKADWKNGSLQPILKGKTLAMIFQKASTRTRVSFEVAMYQLGGLGLFLSANDLQIGRGEPVQDTARVLASFCDGILIRTFSHQEVQDLAAYSKVPVINGLTDDEHPTQALADMLTILEHRGPLQGQKLVYVGDGNNVAVSLIHACALTGMEIVLACPKGYQLPQKALAEGERIKVEGAKITVTEDIREAVKDADVLYTDVWTSMGQEEETAIRLRDLKDYQINEELLKLAKDDAIVLHCLPAHRGEEITDGVIEGSQSRVFEQAENRMHAHRAILAALL